MTSYKFIRYNNKVVTPDTSWGYGNPPLLVFHEHQNKQVWYKPATMDWSVETPSFPSAHIPAMYMLVRVDGNVATVLEQCTPGHYWKRARERMVELCNEPE